MPDNRWLREKGFHDRPAYLGAVPAYILWSFSPADIATPVLLRFLHCCPFQSMQASAIAHQRRLDIALFRR
jgi:hypothetical protein